MPQPTHPNQERRQGQGGRGVSRADVGVEAAAATLSCVPPFTFEGAHSKKGVDMGNRMQRLKGKLNQASGRTKSKAGYASGRPRTELKGDTQQLKGEAQEAVGKARHKLGK